MGVHSLSSMLLLSLLVILSVSAVSVSAADAAMINKICQYSTDFRFCNYALTNDSRTAAADIDGLSVISVSITITTVQETIENITTLRNNAGRDSVLMVRCQHCLGNYTTAYSKFNEAWNSALAKSYYDVLNLLRDGWSAASACQNSFRSDGWPISTSPLTERTSILLQDIELVELVIQQIISPTKLEDIGLSKPLAAYLN